MYDDKLIQEFFDYVVQRQLIYYKRHILKYPYPWSDDNILTKHRFCNVFRIKDRVTIHILEAINKIPKDDVGNIVFNTIISRIFNTPYQWNYTPIQDYRNFNFDNFIKLLEEQLANGIVLFSPAYLLCQKTVNNDLPRRKYIQYSKMFEQTSEFVESLAKELLETENPFDLFPIIRKVYMVGGFIGYQILLDLAAINFWNGRITDNDFVFIGPGSKPLLRRIANTNKQKELMNGLYHLRDNQEQYINNAIKTYGEGFTWKEISEPEATCHPWLSLSDIQFNLCEKRKYYKRMEERRGRVRLFKPGEDDVVK